MRFVRHSRHLPMKAPVVFVLLFNGGCFKKTHVFDPRTRNV